MKQIRFAASGSVKKPRQTRNDPKEKFLQEMGRGRALDSMAGTDRSLPQVREGSATVCAIDLLRIHFQQQWFGYSDAAMEEALHEVPLLRHFAGLDAGMDWMPDETTILDFRHRLERHGLSKPIFAEVRTVHGAGPVAAGKQHGEKARVSADRGYDYPVCITTCRCRVRKTEWPEQTRQALDAWTKGRNHGMAKRHASIRSGS